MPDLFDCPREIRDMIYTIYFTDLLEKDSCHRMQNELIFSVDHALAREAIEAAMTVMNAAVTAAQRNLERQEGKHLKMSEGLKRWDWVHWLDKERDWMQRFTLLRDRLTQKLSRQQRVLAALYMGKKVLIAKGF